MASNEIGFVGLGNMGRPMATNLVKPGRSVVVHDAAGTQARAPQGAELAASNAALAGRVEVIHLCVPDGRASESIAREVAGAPERRTRLVVDHSTIGTAAAVRVHALLAGHGVEYVDAPVSGGVSGAVDATLAIMYSGSGTTFETLRPVFEAMAGNVFRVGSRPGQGQAMKVLNNFLSGTAMAATAEAVAFGVRQGLDMKMILDVVNASSGRNTATTDKFPNRVLTGTWDAGFSQHAARQGPRALSRSGRGHRRLPPRQSGGVGPLAAPRSARAERGHLARLPVRARCAPIDRRGVTREARHEAAPALARCRDRRLPLHRAAAKARRLSWSREPRLSRA